MGLSRIAALTAAVAGMLAASVTGAMAQSRGAAPGQWPMAGQNIYDTHFQVAEHVISPANASRLAPRWTLTTAGAVSATPTVSGGVVYVPDYGGKLWAVAAASGRVLWSRDISGYTGVAGDVSRTSPAVYGRDLILGDGWILNPSQIGARVFAVDRYTGTLVWSTQVDTDPAAVITSSPVVYRGVAYLGISSKGEAERTRHVPRGSHRAGRGHRHAAVEDVHRTVEQRQQRLQQARLLQRQRGVVLQSGHRPGPGAAVRGHWEQLHRARRGLHHARPDGVYPARRR